MKSGYQGITSWDKIHTRRHAHERWEIQNKPRSKHKADPLKLKKKKKPKMYRRELLIEKIPIKLKMVENF